MFSVFLQVQIKYLGCWWSELPSFLLAKLFRVHRWSHLGGGLGRRDQIERLPSRAEKTLAGRGKGLCFDASSQTAVLFTL